MRDLMMRWATPLTAGLFLVSTVSGVALFFGWQPGAFHEMHEILSMVLLAPVAVHLWRNWRALLGYFKRVAMPAALALSVVAGLAFAYPSLGGGNARAGNPNFALIAAAERAPLADVAPILHLDAAAAVKRLTDAGYGAVTPSDSIAAIAARSGAEPIAVLAKLTAPAAP